MERVQESIQQLVGEGSRVTFFSQESGGSTTAPPWLPEGEVLSIYQQTLDQVQSYLARSRTYGKVWAEMNRQGVTLTAADSLLFEQGSAEPGPEAAPLIDIVAALLERYSLKVEIRGHTDDLPIATSRYPSNWALSAARSAAVALQLSMRGVEGSRMEVIGYADTRPLARPLAGNPVGLEKVRARNRRVELLLVHTLAPPSMSSRHPSKTIRSVGVDSPPRLVTDPASDSEEKSEIRQVRIIPAVPELPGFPGSERVVIEEELPPPPTTSRRTSNPTAGGDPFNGRISRGE